MRKFSEREGHSRMKNKIQRDKIDTDLKNGIWNALTIYYWQPVILMQGTINPKLKHFKELARSIWIDYFKRRIDSIPNVDNTTGWERFNQFMEKYYDSCKWFEIYDLIEFMASYSSLGEESDGFQEYTNTIFERELSAYRFAAGMVTAITSDEELISVDEAMRRKGHFSIVTNHLKTASHHMSNRKNPDYRNSVLESISAVRSLCQLILPKQTADLTEVLDKVTSKSTIPIILREGIETLFQFTYKGDEIHHSLLDQENISYDEAKYMLVSSSVLTNYLIIKAQQAKILKK